MNRLFPNKEILIANFASVIYKSALAKCYKRIFFNQLLNKPKIYDETTPYCGRGYQCLYPFLS